MRSRFGPHAHSAAQGYTPGLAVLASLGSICELFFVKEELFACGKDELLPAIYADKHLIFEFHGRYPKTGNL